MVPCAAAGPRTRRSGRGLGRRCGPDPAGVKRCPGGGPRGSFARPRGEEVIIALTSKQRAQLKSLAHPLKPLLHIGKEGVTGTVVESVREAFNTRELLKVKVLEGAPQSAREIGEDLAWRLEGVELVQVIGRTLVLYRAERSDR